MDRPGALSGTLRVRHAVRAWLAEHPNNVVAVGLSGGADSLALTAAAVAETAEVVALIVDHQLQAGSGDVAGTAAAQARDLGCARVEILPVDVAGPGGLEAAARRARYGALDAARADAPVLLGHTLDDQAETVLLGLARGSGPRSIAGMRAYDPPWGRPLLAVERAATRQACAELGVVPHADPHNADPAFTRVRLRTEVLPLLEDVLGGGVAAALARTAEQIDEDNALLDELAETVLTAVLVGSAQRSEIDVVKLGCHPPALRRRAIRLWLLDNGVRAVIGKHLRAIDALVVAWHGQGDVAVGGGGPATRLVVTRQRGRLKLCSTHR